MVIGHVYAKNSVVVHFIYMFHMGLFFVLSGYFFKDITSVPMLRHFVWRKIKGLYFPYVGFSMLFLFLHNALINVNGGGYYVCSDYMTKIFKIVLTFSGQEDILVGFWFLKALFMASIFYAIISFVLNKMRCIHLVTIVIIAVLVACMAMCNVEKKNLTIFGMLYGCIFFYMGHIIKQKLNECNCNILSMFILALSILVVSRTYNEIANTEFLSVDIKTVLPFAFTTILGSLMVMGLSRVIYAKAHKAIIVLLDFIGSHTMVILALHYPFFIIYERMCQKMGIGYFAPNIVKLIIGIFLPLLILFLLQKIRTAPYLSRLTHIR